MPFTVRLRGDVFTKAARLAGFRSDYALAKKMEINRSTVARVLSGDLNPGPAFIAGALHALAPMQFDDLFDVVRHDRDLDMQHDARLMGDSARPVA
ncbi:transcriptional regulator [Saccharothrix sp. DSM 118769]